MKTTQRQSEGVELHCFAAGEVGVPTFNPAGAAGCRAFDQARVMAATDGGISCHLTQPILLLPERQATLLQSAVNGQARYHGVTAPYIGANRTDLTLCSRTCHSAHCACHFFRLSWVPENSTFRGRSKPRACMPRLQRTSTYASAIGPRP